MLQDRLSTALSGLDEVLHPGLISTLASIVQGAPGTSKITLALHFL